MTAIEIIEETVKFYNSNNRSYILDETESQKCRYKSGEKTCAFGRVVKDTDLVNLEEGRSAIFNIQFLGLRIIKDEYIIGNNLSSIEKFKINSEFYNDLQQLHDTAINWNELGLTESGKVVVENLINKYKNDYSN